jgi:hypothetical protein
MMAAIKEHERVILTRTMPDERLEAGDVGTVVHVYRDGLAYEVEFTTLDGRTAAVVTVEASDVRPVSRREITHARTLAS